MGNVGSNAAVENSLATSKFSRRSISSPVASAALSFPHITLRRRIMIADCVAGPVGALLWSLQLVPQILKSHRHKVNPSLPLSAPPSHLTDPQ